MTLIDKAEALRVAQEASDNSDSPQDVVAAIAALPARGAGVKPLVWEHHNGNYPNWKAQSYPFSAVIERYSGQGEFGLTINGFAKGAHPNLDAAKAAAQADYEARILAALEPALAPTDAAQAREAALREAAAIALRHRSKVQINEELWHEGQDWAAERIAEAILALIGDSK